MYGSTNGLLYSVVYNKSAFAASFSIVLLSVHMIKLCMSISSAGTEADNWLANMLPSLVL